MNLARTILSAFAIAIALSLMLLATIPAMVALAVVEWVGDEWGEE